MRCTGREKLFPKFPLAYFRINKISLSEDKDLKGFKVEIKF